MRAADTGQCILSAYLLSEVHISPEIPDDFPILIPFDSLLVCRKHRIRLFGLLKETAFSAPL